MPYTLSMTALWLLLAAALGFIIGWLLRSSRKSRSAVVSKAVPDTGELDRLRHRVANLEPALAERDSLKLQLGDLEGQLKAAKAASVAAPVATFAGVAQADHDLVLGERDNQAARIAELEAALADCNARRAGIAQEDHDAVVSERNHLHGLVSKHEGHIQSLTSELTALRPVTPDNLQLIVGVGPVIEKILNEGGIFTFEQALAAGVSGIQDILPDMQDARVEKEDWMGQIARFIEAKAAGRNPADVARDGQDK